MAWACSRNSVATLTLNHPEKGNCYDGQMLALIRAQVAALAGEPRVRAIVLRTVAGRIESGLPAIRHFPIPSRRPAHGSIA